MRRRRKIPASLSFESVAKLCISALIEPPHSANALHLQAKYIQARAKLKRWERVRVRSRNPDFRELQANDDTKEQV